VFRVGQRLVAARGVAQARGHRLEPAQRAVVERLIAAAAHVERQPDGVLRLLLLAAGEKREDARTEEESLHGLTVSEPTRPPFTTSETRSTADGSCSTLPGTAMTSASFPGPSE